MIIHGSLRHDSSGRKKKTKGRTTARKPKAAGINNIPSYNYTRGRTDHIPSYTGPGCATTVDPLAKEKLEVCKKYTVAVAYNKGAYQVIPKDSVKHIGR